MSWAADVPFPAEDLGKCRGCGATIGWLAREPEERGALRRPHPVEPKGWAGVRVTTATAGPVRAGYTLAGPHARVVEPPAGALVPPELVVVFESHFAFCPHAKRFDRARKARP